MPSLITELHLEFEKLVEAEEAVVGRLVDFLVNHVNQDKHLVCVVNYKVKGRTIFLDQRDALPGVE